MSYPTPRRSVPAVCFDLDGTLAKDTWPEPHIGEPIWAGFDALKHFFDDGFAIYIYTARPFSHEAVIRFWLEEHGIAHMIYDIRCGKPIADLYVDDRAWNPVTHPAEEPEPEGPEAVLGGPTEEPAYDEATPEEDDDLIDAKIAMAMTSDDDDMTWEQMD